MKKLILFGMMAFCQCVAHADLQSTAYTDEPGSEFGPVPLDNWAYEANAKAVQWVYGDQYKSMSFEPDKGVTRYEFAISVARMEEIIESGQKLPSGTDPLAVKDVLAALHREFNENISRLGVRMG